VADDKTTTKTGSGARARSDGDGRGKTTRARRYAHATVVAHLTPEERVARGKIARTEVPRSSHGFFEAVKDRPDPVALLEEQAQTRVPELVPIRYGRMLVSPFTFYRGAALIMASDLATTPTSGLHVQACGDAHLSNFGVYGSPERRLMFDVNDFDETLPGPWEWDVKRLAASLEIAGRNNEYSDADHLVRAVDVLELLERMVLDGYRPAVVADEPAHHLVEGVGRRPRRRGVGERDDQRRVGDDAQLAARRVDALREHAGVVARARLGEILRRLLSLALRQALLADLLADELHHVVDVHVVVPRVERAHRRGAADRLAVLAHALADDVASVGGAEAAVAPEDLEARR